ASNFPTTSGAPQTAYGGNTDGFLTKLNPQGTGVVYSTFLGGGSSDQGNGVVVDASGNAFVAGQTQSSNFPTTTGAFKTSKPSATGVNSGFIAEVNAAGTSLVYATYFGGSGAGGDAANAIALDHHDDAFVT